jgi:membrane-associated phospholipid phosphatase
VIARPGLALAVATLVTLLGSPAKAQPRPLRWDPSIDFPVTLAGAALAISAELLRPELAPRKCRWCNPNEFDSAARAALLWSDPHAANVASNITGIGLAPVAAFGLDALAASHDGYPRAVPLDALLVMEALVLAIDATEIAKVLIGRERPLLRAHSDPPRPPTANDNLSFFSGHATETAALAAASGTVATMRGYRWAPLTWAVGGAIAAATAYLRIGADEHWLSDVLVGLAVGVGIGFAVPYVFHGPMTAAGP